MDGHKKEGDRRKQVKNEQSKEGREGEWTERDNERNGMRKNTGYKEGRSTGQRDLKRGQLKTRIDGWMKTKQVGRQVGFYKEDQKQYGNRRESK